MAPAQQVAMSGALFFARHLVPLCITVQQVGLAYGPIRACSYSYTAQAAGPQRSPRKASLTPGSPDAMREKSMFAAYIDASVGHS